MQQGPKPTFYGLLYVDENQQGNTNIRGRGDQLDIYLHCAVYAQDQLPTTGITSNW